MGAQGEGGQDSRGWAGRFQAHATASLTLPAPRSLRVGTPAWHAHCALLPCPALAAPLCADNIEREGREQEEADIQRMEQQAAEALQVRAGAVQGGKGGWRVAAPWSLAPLKFWQRVFRSLGKNRRKVCVWQQIWHGPAVCAPTPACWHSYSIPNPKFPSACSKREQPVQQRLRPQQLSPAAGMQRRDSKQAAAAASQRRYSCRRRKRWVHRWAFAPSCCILPLCLHTEPAAPASIRPGCAASKFLCPARCPPPEQEELFDDDDDDDDDEGLLDELEEDLKSKAAL